MSGEQDGRQLTRKEKIARLLVGGAGALDDQSEPIGDDDMPPRYLYLTDEWLNELDVKYNGQRYRFVVENGELGLEKTNDQ